MKKFYIGISLVIVLFLGLIYSNDTTNTKKEIFYNDDGLLVSIDGVSSSTLPMSGTYYLVNYDCKNKNTKLSWDRDNNKLSVTNGNSKASIACYLEFKSNPKLSEMPVGSYVEYIGNGGMVGSRNVSCQNNDGSSSFIATDETEAPKSCLGQNAREDIDENGNSYGYCYSSNYKYYVSGWRIAYINNNKPVIISAGSPECNSRVASDNNVTYTQYANSKALKYCNADYVDGDCSCVDINEDGLCDSASSDAWAVSDTDFYHMTKSIGGIGKRLTDGSSNLGDVGGTLNKTLSCYGNYSYEECGYNNDLIDNGGFYWFAASYVPSMNYGVAWYPDNRAVEADGSVNTYGLRPVINLSSSVVVIGGNGTMEDPYKIANNSFKVVSSVDEVGNVNYGLNLMASPSVTQMCVNVNSSGCSNYVDFVDTYALDLSAFVDGENVVYVYYKNSNGALLSALIRNFTYEEELEQDSVDE